MGSISGINNIEIILHFLQIIKKKATAKSNFELLSFRLPVRMQKIELLKIFFLNLMFESHLSHLRKPPKLLQTYSISPLNLALSICLGPCVLLRRVVNERLKLVQNHGVYRFHHRLQRWEARPFCPFPVISLSIRSTFLSSLLPLSFPFCSPQALSVNLQPFDSFL